MFKKDIEAGMGLLDEHYHNQSWVLMIDLGELDLKSGCNCILGQLVGDYDQGLDEMNVQGDGSEYGFAVDLEWQRMENDEENASKLWDKLTEEWIEAIKRRIDLGLEV